MKVFRIAAILSIAIVGTYWIIALQKPAENTSNDFTRISTGLGPAIRIEGRELVLSSLEERMVHYKVPGVSIAFLENHQIAGTLTIGVADHETGQLVDENTVFQAASISKPVFATTLMRYRQEHDIDLDLDVNLLLSRWHLPPHDWQATDSVTLRRLLSHSAGTTVHGFGGYAAGEVIPDLVNVLDGQKPANSAPVVVDIKPGSQFRYSGGGTALAQLAFEDKAGDTLLNISERLVFSPLEMTRSTYAQPLTPEFATNAARPYRASGEPVEGGAHTYAARAAAGLWTTPSDLMRLASATQLSYKGETSSWLDQASAREMLTMQQEPLGIGFFLNGSGEKSSFSHGGANEGYRANFFALTDSGSGIAIMTNSDNGGSLIKEIMIRVSEIYGWEAASPTVKNLVILRPDQLDQFIGEYQLIEPAEFSIQIARSDEGLLVNVAHYLIDVTFLPEDENTFFAMDGSILQFERDEDGSVATLKLHGNTARKIETADHG